MKIEIQNLTKSFNLPKRKQIKTVIDDFNFCFETGNFYILRGASGSGKSTLLSLIGLLDIPTSGTIVFSDYASSSKPITKGFGFASKYISYMLQSSTLNLELTCLQNIEMFITQKYDVIHQVAQDLGITHILEKKAVEASKGEKQRLLIARAILERKEIVIFDEPTANLDNENSQSVFATIRKYCSDKLVIIATHENVNDVVFPHYLIEFLDSGIVAKGKFPIEASAVMDSTEIPFSRNRLSRVFTKGSVVSLFSRGKTRFFLTMFLQFFILALSSVFFEISRINVNSEISQSLYQSEIRMVEVEKNTVADNQVYRPINLYVASLSTAFNFIYSEDDSFHFASNNFLLSDFDIVIPQSFATSHSLAIGDHLLIENIESHVASIYEDNSEKYMDNLSLFLTENSQLTNAVKSTTPILVSSLLVKNYLKGANISFPSATFSSLTNYINTTTGETFLNPMIRHIPIINLPQSKNEITLIFNDQLEPVFDSAFSSILGKTFEIELSNSELDFDFSDYAKFVSVTAFEYSFVPGIFEFIIAISDELMNEILEDAFRSGLGTNGCFSLPNEYFRSNDFVVSGLNSFGVISDVDYQGLVLFSGVVRYSPFLFLFFIAVLLILYVYFFIGLRNLFLRDNCSLYLLGFGPKNRGIPLFYTFILCAFLPIIFSLILAFFAPAINSAILNLFSFTGYFCLVPNIVVGVLLSVAIGISFGALFSFFASRLKPKKVFSVLKDAKE